MKYTRGLITAYKYATSYKSIILFSKNKYILDQNLEVYYSKILCFLCLCLIGIWALLNLSHLSEQNGHLVSPAALVERCHPDPQVQLRVVHPHITTVDTATCKTKVHVVKDDKFLCKMTGLQSDGCKIFACRSGGKKCVKTLNYLLSDQVTKPTLCFFIYWFLIILKTKINGHLVKLIKEKPSVNILSTQLKKIFICVCIKDKPEYWLRCS